jgi:hypothetical protein
MANHKRRKPKEQRAGCMMCKPWKWSGSRVSHFTSSERRDLLLTEDELEDVEFEVRLKSRHTRSQG